ncbi:MAG: hypothetical protein AB1758_01245 [Candidatus Eremiobacterota bacterium]
MAKLWRAAEGQLARRFPSFSVDELTLLRDDLWFRHGDRPELRDRSLPEYVESLSKAFLWVRHGRARPRCYPDPGVGVADLPARGRWAWRWLTLSLPPDLLLAAVDCPESSVDILSEPLARVLADRRVAETHLHLGAAALFDRWWMVVQATLAGSATKWDIFGSPGAEPELGEGAHLGPLLLRGAVVRWALAWWLESGSGSVKDAILHLQGWLRAVGRGPEATALGRAIGHLERVRGLEPGPSDWKILQDLYGFLGGRDARLTRRRAWPPAPGISLHQLPEFDPVHRLIRPRHSRWSPEMSFVRAGLEKCSTDRLFERLFWQVMRIRLLAYRHVVQYPLTPGLQWFIRHYCRATDAHPGTFGVTPKVESAAELGGHTRGFLRSLEVRMAPKTSMGSLRAELNGVERALKRLLQLPDRRSPTAPPVRRDFRPKRTEHPLELGVVYHFTKERGKQARRGLQAGWGLDLNEEPSGRNWGWRFRGFFREREQQALALARLLRERPLLLNLVRGIDVCTDEIGVPTWVLLPMLRHVLCEASQAVRRVDARWPELACCVAPLRVTVHCGEDFVHLLTGLRRVGELVRYAGLKEGDRIGHGIALGIDPAEWAARAGRVPLTREERLFDLIWLWQVGTDPSLGLPSGTAQWLQGQLGEFSQRIFGELRPPELLSMFADSLHQCRVLRRLGYAAQAQPRVPAASLPPHLKLVHDYLRNRQVYRRGREIVWVPTEPDAEVLAVVQNRLRAVLARLHVTIEMNPTSNVLIANLGNIQNHPLWRMNPPEGYESEGPTLPVCIGSDDPIIFATTLPEEYQYLMDFVGLRGLSAEKALHWVDRLRQNGLAARFTLPYLNLDQGRHVRYLSDAVDRSFPLRRSVLRPCVNGVNGQPCPACTKEEPFDL